MSTVTAQQLNTLAYKTMNPLIYYSVNVAIYVTQIILALTISSIGDVFNFIATFAGTGLCFFIPSTLFYKGYHKFATEDYKNENRCWYIVAIINFVLGIGFFALFLYANI